MVSIQWWIAAGTHKSNNVHLIHVRTGVITLTLILMVLIVHLCITHRYIRIPVMSTTVQYIPTAYTVLQICSNIWDAESKANRKKASSLWSSRLLMPRTRNLCRRVLWMLDVAVASLQT